MGKGQCDAASPRMRAAFGGHKRRLRAMMSVHTMRDV